LHKDYDRALLAPKNTPFTNSTRQGLAFVSGDTWKRQRTVIAKAFEYNNVADMVPAFVKKSKILLEMLGDYRTKNVDMKEWFKKLTLDVLGVVVFGMEFDTLHGFEGIHEEAFRAFLTYKLPIVELLFPLYSVLPIPENKRKFRRINALAQLKKKIIENKKNAKSQSLDLVDVLLGSPLISEEELMHNMSVFFIAGHETTVIALCWAIHFFAKYQDLQQIAYNEIIAVLGDRDPTAEDIKKLAFLDMFIKEVLRIAPPFAASFPISSNNSTELCGIKIPQQTKLVYAIYTIHHLHEFWPEPEKFDPYRFTQENSKDRHPYAYLPFGVGRRTCIGKDVTILQEKVVLASIIRKYELIFVRDAIAQFSFFFPVDSAMVGLKLRVR